MTTDVSLDDKYGFDGRPFYLNGTQALVRLTMLELRRRAAEGKHTAVYASGYRGSPLGIFDQAMWQARKQLGPDIVLNPGVNEDLAATAIWGTQQVGTFGEGKYDGVSALWYGKGPGVDRTGDVFKHANLAGTSAEGGVLVVAGDDHTCKSSTAAHQSEYGLVDALIPVLVPAGVSEIIEYGLIGWAMSRYSGAWIGLKVVTEIMDSAVSLAADPKVEIVTPTDFAMPPGGLSLRWPDSTLVQEERLHRQKIPAVLAFARANKLDKVILDSRKARIGIVTVGKAHLDTMQALADLGIDEVRAAELGIRLYKVAMPWPLEPQGLKAFAEGLEQIVVVEEKRGLIEDQIRQHLYGVKNPPVIVGKHDEDGAWLFPSNYDLEAGMIAAGVGERLLRLTGDEAVAARLASIRQSGSANTGLERLAERPPHFCPGCPHNTSTKVPEGSKAFAGIGCHFLSQLMERETAGFTHMGGEGANWIGLAPFSKTPHMFQNIGDGTYFHSGSLAIRASIAAKVNVTYKVLFNGAVAMTGGQPMDGELTPASIAGQLKAEGAKRIVVVADDPTRYPAGSLPEGIPVHHRRELDAVQRELREVEGVTVIIYDQACATELRRKRKRGKIADPNVAVVINDLVCEGCGDCSVKSNCLSVVPVDTEFGRKRAVDLSTCNKDRSCLEGFCPSFVTVEGATPRKSTQRATPPTDLPEPVPPALDHPFSMLMTGIGGTGIVTIGALLGVAAHLEGKAVRVMDMTGLAQKGGAVVTHLQIGRPGAELHSSKISLGRADVLIGCDAVVAAAPENLSRVSKGGDIVANDHETITGRFTREADFALPVNSLRRQLTKAVEPGHATFCDATDLATKLVGDAVGANLFLLGFAYQKGLVPVSAASLDRAIELNGVAIGLNRAAFAWGRKAALDLEAVKQAAIGDRPRPEHHRLSETLDETIERRVVFLTDYQDQAYAARYRAAVDKVAAAERAATPGDTSLTLAAAKSLFRLMAYKDEYEVARLHAESGFFERLSQQFDGPFTVSFHMAPPILAKPDKTTGRPRKMKFGPWMATVLKVLAKGRRLRGTPLDVFGYTPERRAERARIGSHLALLDEVARTLTPANHAAAIALVQASDAIKGYGHVKDASAVVAEVREANLLASYRSGDGADRPVRSEAAAVA